MALVYACAYRKYRMDVRFVYTCEHEKILQRWWAVEMWWNETENASTSILMGLLLYDQLFWYCSRHTYVHSLKSPSFINFALFRGDEYDCGIFTYRGNERELMWYEDYTRRRERDRQREICVDVFRILWNDPFKIITIIVIHIHTHTHTLQIGYRQLKPKRCLCDFGELPKLIRATNDICYIFEMP